MTIDGSQWPSAGDEIHVLVTGNGSPYIQRQMRLLYRTFLKAQRMPDGHKMVAFTRILSCASEHSAATRHALSGQGKQVVVVPWKRRQQEHADLRNDSAELPGSLP